MKKNLTNLLTAHLLTFLFVSAVYSDVHTSTSCDRGAVQLAISGASDGDTVIVPAGTVTWTSGVTINNKNIIFKGAGMGQTVIVCNAAYPLSVTAGTGKPFRITGFTFDGTGITGVSNTININNGTFFGFRIDHCSFVNVKHAIHTAGQFSEGLIDHCTFYCMEAESGDHVQIGMGSDMNSAWKRPLAMGTSNAVYVEDCFFEFFGTGNSDRPYVATGDGAKIVFRHNVAKNGCFEIFGAYSYYTSARGGIIFEAYDNVFSGNCYTVFTIKAGTGNIFNNTITGSFGGAFELTDYRSIPYGAAIQYGACDGMHAIDGNGAIETGTHTGSSNQQVLTCTSKSWTSNQWVGYALWNMTDNSVGRITSNTSNTISMSGGMVEGYTTVDSGNVTSVNGQQMTCTGKSWQWGGLEDICYVYNVTDGSYGKITSNGATTITAALSGGSSNSWHVGDVFRVTQGVPQSNIEKDWDTGDSFKIANGWPCLDQIGLGQDADADNIQPQFSFPLYEWNNTINGGNLNPYVSDGGTAPCGEQDHIKAGRDYYVDTPRPGYSPYIYPHPLALDIVDTSSPTAPSAVRDGTGTTDISSTTSRTQLSANWTASTDAESGISGYQYAIGTTAGGTNIANWTTNGSLTVTRTGLNLAVGTTYYFSVKATNGVGLAGGATNSNGQVVISTAVADTTAPSAPGTVRDGPTAGTDESFTYSTTTLSANWSAATDGESGISRYDYSIGTSPGGTNVLGWTALGNVLTATKTGLSLTIGTTYYFSVRAVNGAGLTGIAGNSNGQYVKVINTGDTTPPSPPSQVRDGTSATADIGYTASTTELSANWDASADIESGISRYYFAIGTSPGATDVTNWTDNGPNTSVTQTGLSLVTGTTYYFSVKAENGVGLQSDPTNSDGQYVISAVSQSPVISNVQAANITANSAVITWDTDMPATSQVEYGLTTGYGMLTIEDINLVTAHSVTLTGLVSGEYHYKVISRDAGGNESESTDNTFNIICCTEIETKIYPNPVDFSNGQKLTFAVSGNSCVEIAIYTISGKLARKLTGTGIVDWNGTNENGEEVTRGVYIYRITGANGDSITGKIAIKRWGKY